MEFLALNNHHMHSCLLFLLGIVLIVIGLIYLGLKKPIMEEDVEFRKLELEELVRMFQQEAESHAQVRKSTSEAKIPSGAATVLHAIGDDYVLLS